MYKRRSLWETEWKEEYSLFNENDVQERRSATSASKQLKEGSNVCLYVELTRTVKPLKHTQTFMGVSIINKLNISA